MDKKLEGKPGQSRRRKATELKRCHVAQCQRGRQIRRARLACLLFPDVAESNEGVDMRLKCFAQCTDAHLAIKCVLI